MMMFRFLLGLLLLLVVGFMVCTNCYVAQDMNRVYYVHLYTLATRSLFAYLNCLVTKQ